MPLHGNVYAGVGKLFVKQLCPGRGVVTCILSANTTATGSERRVLIMCKYVGDARPAWQHIEHAFNVLQKLIMCKHFNLQFVGTSPAVYCSSGISSTMCGGA